MSKIPAIQEYTTQHPQWQAYLDHLQRVDVLRHALDEEQPKQNTYYLGIWQEERIVGHISIQLQPIVAPATPWSENQDIPILDSSGQVLKETFVQTFAVEGRHQRRGYGRALQQAALDKTRALGGYQMRSWSSTDRPANYALKVAMGFAVHPAVYRLPSGREISGVYFVMRVWGYDD